MFEEFSLQMAQSSMRRKKKMRFRMYRKLQGMLDMNEPLPTALDRLWRNVSDDGRKQNAPAAIAVAQWLERSRRGASIADMMEGWLPAREIMLLRAGEESGNVGKAISSIMTM